MSRGSIRKAVIPAAGLGTRFLPATKAVPKEMLPIVDVPTIQLVVEEAINAGIEDIVIINGRLKTAIEDHFDHAFELEHTLRERGKTDLHEQTQAISSMLRLISVRQKQPLGLGHAVLCARPVIGDEPFAVLLGDDLIDNDDEPGIGQLCDVHARMGAAVVAVMEVAPGDEKLYGIIDAEPMPGEDGLLRVRDMVEKPDPSVAPSRLAVIGRYVLPPHIWPLLENLAPGVGGEIQLTDAAWLFPLRVIVPALLLVHFFRRGEYPELRTLPPGGAAGIAQDVAVGLAGALVWMAPTVWLGRDAFPGFLQPAADAGFDPTVLGEGAVGLALALRVVGYAAVTPFAEELFVRSWLARWLEVFDSRRDFRSVPIAHASLRSFLGVVLFLTASHVPWEWPVAVLWIVGTHLWFYRRRHLASVVVAHAASNLAIFVAVLLADRAGRDLWYFL